MTAYANRGRGFNTQHVLERNHNKDSGLVFWPKRIRMDSFRVQKPNFGAAFAYCPVRWGTDFVPNSIILVFEYGTVFPWCGGDALTSYFVNRLCTTSTSILPIANLSTLATSTSTRRTTSCVLPALLSTLIRCLSVRLSSPLNSTPHSGPSLPSSQNRTTIAHLLPPPICAAAIVPASSILGGLTSSVVL
jgi:hypothetical protein